MTSRLYTVANGGLPNANITAQGMTVAGDLITWLKAALVTGYGGKAGAGWALLYESLTNDEDPSHRIALRSQSLHSERLVFVIEDADGQEAQLKMARDWDEQQHQPLDVFVQLKIHKSGASELRNSGFVLADEKSCWFSAAGIVCFMGDYHGFNAIQPTSLILGNVRTDGADSYYSAPPTLHRSGHRKMCDRLGTNYYFKWDNGYNNYGYLGMATRYGRNWEYRQIPLRVGDEIWVEPWQVVTRLGEYWIPVGTMPHLVFSDFVPTEGAKVRVGEHEKTIVWLMSNASGALFFAVDEA